VPPVIFGFNPSLPESVHDPARARALLAAAGFPHGFSVRLQVRQMVGQAADPLRGMLAEVGIQVNVAQLPEHEFFEAADAIPSFYLTRYGCDNGDSSDILNAGIHSVDPERRLGNVNFGHYSNLALDRAIEASAEESDHDARRGQLQAIMAAALDDLVLIPLYFDEDVYLVRRPLTFRPRDDSYVLASEIGVELAGP
jgi:peptide/nickel transport system substrate-binding protein